MIRRQVLELAAATDNLKFYHNFAFDYRSREKGWLNTISLGQF